ncbi:gp436 family protein [Paracoccus sp. (in: a-proteobacteria)]|uniref:gp436 family protein n=1 Tax=Paracoccus sp. TaxID=267 RepID=UPI0035AF18D1
MPYATTETIARIYGDDFLADITSEDADQVEAVAEALDQASAEIDGYLSVRYSLPRPTAPRVLERPCVDIAIYILANSHTRLTTTIEDRYKQAIRFLELLSSGKAGLGADEPVIDTGVGGTGSSSGADFSANPRRWGRRSSNGGDC